MGPPGGPTDSWRIYNGSLYINFFPAVMDEFFEPSKVSSHIAAADERWAGMWGAAEKVGPFNYLCGGYSTQEVSLHLATHLALIAQRDRFVGAGPFIPSDCWVPGTKPGEPDCCGKHPQPIPPTVEGGGTVATVPPPPGAEVAVSQLYGDFVHEQEIDRERVHV